MSEASQPVFGILCTGRPAFGLNAVIASANLYAIKLGRKVIRFNEGYKSFSTCNPDAIEKSIIELKRELIDPNEDLGGSISITDRFDRTKTPQTNFNFLEMPKYLEVCYLAIL